MSPEPWEGSTPGGHHRAGACSQPGVSPVQTLTVTPNSGSSLDPGTDTRGFPTDATQHSGHSNWAFCSREESVFQTWRASQFWDVPQVVSCSLLQTRGPPHTQGPLWHMDGVLSLPTEVRWACPRPLIWTVSCPFTPVTSGTVKVGSTLCRRAAGVTHLQRQQRGGSHKTLPLPATPTPPNLKGQPSSP